MDDLRKEYKKLAKKINQRLVRSERTEGASGTYQYKTIQDRIASVFDDSKINARRKQQNLRFPENPNVLTDKQIKDGLRQLQIVDGYKNYQQGVFKKRKKEFSKIVNSSNATHEQLQKAYDTIASNIWDEMKDYLPSEDVVDILKDGEKNITNIVGLRDTLDIFLDLSEDERFDAVYHIERKKDERKQESVSRG